MNYYNEFNPFTARWLRNLAKANKIPQGVVDDRSIVEVKSADLSEYEQCHFFAGVGGWSDALEIAGWKGPVWTGSCPCQPFSVIGEGKGIDDERHLWPEFLRLITELRPPTIFGEQVAGTAGRAWLAGVRSDLEKLGYAVGAADLCSAGIGAPTISQRLYWVAAAESNGLQKSKKFAGGIGGVAAEEKHELRLDNRRNSERLIRGRDGNNRRIEPGIEPLVDVFPAWVEQLRGYGNAINPVLAAEFISSIMEVL